MVKKEELEKIVAYEVNLNPPQESSDDAKNILVVNHGLPRVLHAGNNEFSEDPDKGLYWLTYLVKYEAGNRHPLVLVSAAVATDKDVVNAGAALVASYIREHNLSLDEININPSVSYDSKVRAELKKSIYESL